MVHLDDVTQPNQLAGLMCKLLTRSKAKQWQGPAPSAGRLQVRGAGLTLKVTLGLGRAGNQLATLHSGQPRQWAPRMDDGADYITRGVVSESMESVRQC